MVQRRKILHVTGAHRRGSYIIFFSKGKFPRSVFLKGKCANESPEGSVTLHTLIQWVQGRALRVCTSNKLPGDAAGLWTTLGVARVQTRPQRRRDQAEEMTRTQPEGRPQYEHLKEVTEWGKSKFKTRKIPTILEV